MVGPSVVYNEDARAKIQCNFNGVCYAAAALFFHGNPVNDNLDIVNFIPVGFHPF